jgi:hypothetical protein
MQSSRSLSFLTTPEVMALIEEVEKKRLQFRGPQGLANVAVAYYEKNIHHVAISFSRDVPLDFLIP